jgi:hypothetical protein
MLQRIKSTNIIFNDISEQPEGKYVLIFHTIGGAKGAVSFDVTHQEDGVIKFEKIVNGEWVAIAILPVHSDWIVLAADRVSKVSVEDYFRKTAKDEVEVAALEKELYPKGKASQEQQPVFLMMPPGGEAKESDPPQAEPYSKEPVGHYF